MLYLSCKYVTNYNFHSQLAECFNYQLGRTYQGAEIIKSQWRLWRKTIRTSLKTIENNRNRKVCDTADTWYVIQTQHLKLISWAYSITHWRVWDYKKVILIVYHLQPFCSFLTSKERFKFRTKNALSIRSVWTFEICELSTPKFAIVRHWNLRKFDVEICESSTLSKVSRMLQLPSTLSKSSSCRNFERFKINDEG